MRTYSNKREELPELVLDSYGESDVYEIEAMFKTLEKGILVKFNKEVLV